MQIIPAIDIIEGKCVRLVEGNYTNKKIYAEQPLDVALQFEDAGLSRLHLVDLDGAKAGKVENWKTLETIARHTSLQIDFSGGIHEQADVTAALNAGASWVSIGSMAVTNEEKLVEWLHVFGVEKFMIGADVKNEQIVIRGWTETTTIHLFNFIKKYAAHGIQQFFCTDVAKDGKLAGPSLLLYENILKQFPSLFLIASGGVSSVADLEALEAIGCKAAIVGKAIYEKKIPLKALHSFQLKNIKG